MLVNILFIKKKELKMFPLLTVAMTINMLTFDIWYINIFCLVKESPPRWCYSCSYYFKFSWESEELLLLFLFLPPIFHFSSIPLELLDLNKPKWEAAHGIFPWDLTEAGKPGSLLIQRDLKNRSNMRSFSLFTSQQKWVQNHISI